MSEFNIKEANKVLEGVSKSVKLDVDISKYSQEELINIMNDSFDKDSIYITNEVLQKGLRDGIIEKPIKYGDIIVNKEKLNEESNSALSFLIETLRKHGHNIHYK